MIPAARIRGILPPRHIRFKKYDPMARKYKVKRIQKSRMARMFPDPVQAFVARRIVDATGVFFLALGAFVLLAIASYNRTDPSSGTATSNPVQNWMGVHGASLADNLLQTMGLGGCVFGATMIAWGWALLARRGLSPVWLRFVAMVFGAITAAAAFARLSSGDWLTQPHMGGAFGMKLLQMSTDIFGGDGGLGFMAGIWAGVAALFTCVAFTIGMAEIKWVAALAVNIVMAAGYALYDGATAFVNWVRHYADSEYEPEAKPKKARKPIIPQLESDDDDEEILLESEDDEDEEEEDEDSDEDDEEESDEETDEYDEDEEEDEEDSPRGIRVNKPKQTQKGTGKNARQKKFQLFDGGEWELPTLDLLADIEDDSKAAKIDEKVLQMNATLLQNVLNDFNVKGDIKSINPGPVVTLYELEPAPGTKTSRVIGLADDIARSMSAVSVRAAVVPGRNVIGIELPNKIRQTVYLREQLSTRDYEKPMRNYRLFWARISAAHRLSPTFPACRTCSWPEPQVPVNPWPSTR
jgi:S-DNA-T family DNA segregation ATPase FtsK/SpoIIIE